MFKIHRLYSARRLTGGFVASFAGLALIASPASAASLSWDQAGSGALGGTGTWDTTTTNWWNGSTDVAWATNTISGDSAVFAGTAGTVTLGTNINGVGLTFNTTGYTIATGTNTLTLGSGGIDASGLSSGTTTISGTGALTLGAAQSWNVGSGATLTVSAPVATGGFLLTNSGAGSTNISGVISGTGGLTQSGSGTLTLSTATNTFSGGLTISGGTVAVDSNLRLGGAGGTAGAVTINGGALRMNLGTGAQTNTHVITVGASGGTIVVNSTSGTPTYILGNAGNLTGSGDLAVSGTGTLTQAGSAGASVLVMGNANTGYTGNVTISNGGIVEYANSRGIAPSSTFTVNNLGMLSANGVTIGQAVNVNDGGYLAFQNNSSGLFSGPITLTGNTTVRMQNWWSSAVNNGTISGNISGTGNLTVNGGSSTSANTLTLTGDNTYTGNTALGTGTTLVSVMPTSRTYAGVISGGGSFTKDGPGTLTLTGANTYTGTTTISNGTVNVGDGTSGSLASTALTFSGSGGTINFNEAAGSSQSMGALTFSAGEANVQSTYGGSGNTSLTFSNVVARTAGAVANFVVSGGTTTGATPTNKIVFTQVAGATPTTGTLLDKGYFFGGSNYAAYDTNGYVRDYQTTDTNAASSGAGTSTIANISTNNVFLTGADTAQTTATVNTINMGSTGTIALAAANTLSTDGILVSGNAAATISGGTSLSSATAGGELVIRTDLSTDNLDISTPIVNNTSASALTKGGAGTLTLSATGNSYSGATTVDAGTLSLSGTLTGGGAVTVRSGATLSETSGGGISGASSVTSYGTTTLAGTNTYTGQTTVAGGTLNFSGSLSSAAQINVGVAGGRNAVMNVLPGASITMNTSGTNNIEVGLGTTSATGNGFLYQSGGTITGSTGGASPYTGFRIGDGAVNTSSYGYYNLSGGTTSVNEVDIGGFSGASTGVVDISGGTLNASSWFIVNRTGNSGGVGILNMTGGAVNYTGVATQFQNNWGTNGTAIINIANATLTAANANINLNQKNDASNFGEINLLTGGTLQANSIAPNANGTKLVNFNGGTLKASGATTTFITTNNTGVNVFANGGTIDNNGVNITIPVALLAASGNGVSSVAVNSGGSGYLGAPAVTFSGGGGTGAAGYAVVSGGVVTGIVVTNPGTGYTSAPAITLTGGGGSGAAIGTISTAANTSGGMTFSGSGTTTLSGANTYTGATTINAGTLALGAANRIADASALVLNGGTFATGGFSETMNTLTLSSTSTIDFGLGTSALAFAASNAIAWSGTLNLTNFDIGTDTLRFGTDASALTASQLSEISLTGFTAGLDSSGFVTFTAVPEPREFALAIMGLLGVMLFIRRRKQAN
jgi:autotransporter-associated beta strand protein